MTQGQQSFLRSFVRGGVKRLIQGSVSRPWAVIVTFGLATACLALLLPSLRVETDGRALFAADQPELLENQAIEEHFGSTDLIILGIDLGPEPTARFDSPSVLTAVYHLSERLESMEGLRPGSIRSLATEPVARWSDLGLDLEPALAIPPDSTEEAEAIGRLAKGEPLFERTLVSENGRHLAIFASPEPSADPTADRQALVRQVRRLADEIETSTPAIAKVRLLGSVVAETTLGNHVLSDLSLLLPVSMAVIALLLWFWFRRWLLVAIGLGEAGAVVIWSLAAMALLERPLSLVSVVMPVILATYCVADTIHIGQRVRERAESRREGGRAQDRRTIVSAVTDVARPVICTSLTTGFGFLCFTISPIPPVRDFGLFTAFGVFTALGVSLLVVPAAMVAGRFLERRQAQPAVPQRWARTLEGLAVVATRHPTRVLLTATAVTAGLGIGISQLELRDRWLDNFEQADPLVAADRWFNDGFAGSNLLNVVVSPEPSALAPSALTDLQRFARTLSADPSVGGVRSLADQMRSVGRALDGVDQLPETLAEAREWALLVEMAGGAAALDDFVSPDEGSANLWIYLRQADSATTAGAIARAEAFDWSLPMSEPLKFGGDALLGLALVRSIAKSLVWSLVLALAVTLTTAALMLRSWRAGCLALLPVGLAVTWNFGLMGWLGIPLGVATSTFSAVALGVGVDFALHWLSRRRLELDLGSDPAEATRRTSIGSGSAIVVQGVVMLCGFGVLTLSGVPPTARLGLLMCINIAACLAATLLLMPAVVQFGRRDVRNPSLNHGPRRAFRDPGMASPSRTTRL